MLQPERNDRIGGDGTDNCSDREGHSRSPSGGSERSPTRGQDGRAGDRGPPVGAPFTTPPGAGRGATAGHASGPLPLGFRLVAATLALVGLAAAWTGLQLLAGASALSGIRGGLSGSFSLLGVASLCLGGAHLAAGYGTWSRTAWGRKLALAVAMLGLLGNGTLLFMAGPVALVGFVLYGAMTWYLWHNESRYLACRSAVPPASSSP